MIRSNYHTHTLFCDGKDAPEELIKRALELDFRAIGFSGHSYNDFDGFGMDAERERAYMAEINRLKAEYAGKIEVYLGIEQDYLSAPVREGYDYIIGSVHVVKKKGEYCIVDESLAGLRRIIDELYGGDKYALAEDYYASLADVCEKTGCDIVGHFDLVTKNAERGVPFDEDEPRYRRAYLAAIDALAPKRPVFEINTGAMARGYRTAPYPSLAVLRELKARSLPIMINSDCHDKTLLTHGFDEARAIAQAAGYSERAVIKGGKIELVEL